MSSLDKDFIYYAIMTAVAKGLQFLMLPLLTWFFLPAEYGVIDLIATMTGLAIVLMSLSLESAVARLWQDAQNFGQKKRLYTSIIVFVFGFGAIVFFMAWLAFYAMSKVMSGLENLNTILPLAIGTSLLLSISSIPQMVLRVERRIFKFGVLQVANSALGIAFSLAFIVYFGAGLVGLFLGYFLAALVVAGLSIYLTRKYIQPWISRPDLVASLRYSLPLVPAVFLSWANSQVDRLILLALLGLEVVGIYGAAAKVAAIITVVVEVFRLAWLPNALRHIDQPTRNLYFRNSLIGYLAAMTSIGLVLVTYSRELLTLLTTSEYARGFTVIPWLAGAQIVLGSASITSVGMLISKKTSGNSVAAAMSTVVNVVLGCALVNAFGIGGAAIGTFIAAIVFTSLLLWFSVRQVDIPFDKWHASGMVTIFVVSAVGMLQLYEYATDYSVFARTSLMGLALGVIAFSSMKSMQPRNSVGPPLRTI